MRYYFKSIFREDYFSFSVKNCTLFPDEYDISHHHIRLFQMYSLMHLKIEDKFLNKLLLYFNILRFFKKQLEKIDFLKSTNFGVQSVSKDANGNIELLDTHYVAHIENICYKSGDVDYLPYQVYKRDNILSNILTN